MINDTIARGKSKINKIFTISFRFYSMINVCIKILLFPCLILQTNHVWAQTIINVVLIDSSNQITSKPESARYFIAIKKYSDSSFERLEYKFSGPRLRSVFYKDPELKIKHGIIYTYNDSGYISLSGSYLNNNKSGEWYDSKSNKIQEFENDVLISEKLKEPKDTSKTGHPVRDEVESSYPGGSSSYLRFLNKNMRYPARALSLRKEGQVMLQYIIDTEGKPIGAGIAKSVEFSLDEEALRLISIMPNWIPARQDGKKVKSYKKQPITFQIPVE